MIKRRLETIHVNLFNKKTHTLIHTLNFVCFKEEIFRTFVTPRSDIKLFVNKHKCRVIRLLTIHNEIRI